MAIHLMKTVAIGAIAAAFSGLLFMIVVQSGIIA